MLEIMHVGNRVVAHISLAFCYLIHVDIYISSQNTACHNKIFLLRTEYVECYLSLLG